MTEAELYRTARALLSPQFSQLLKQELSSGCSFPAARQAALSKMGMTMLLTNPNDILGVEYTKAILTQRSEMAVFPVRREGAYHSGELEPHAPSATAVRRALLSGGGWENAVPAATIPLLQSAALHTLEAGERAVVAKLRSMTDEAFARLPYGSEGLWRRLMKAARTQPDLPSIVEAVKSKRYTRTRIDRMILCAFLDLTDQEMGIVPQQIRVLAFTHRGRAVLRSHPGFRNAGEAVDETEKRLGGLYGLFCTQGIEPPDVEEKRRVFYLK